MDRNYRIENKGTSITGNRIYRMYPSDAHPTLRSHLDIGDVIRRTAGCWQARPAVRGEECPEFTFRHFTTRREAVEYLISRV